MFTVYSCTPEADRHINIIKQYDMLQDSKIMKRSVELPLETALGSFFGITF